MKELLLSAFLGSLTSIGTAYLVTLLDQMHEHDAADHKATVQSLHVGLKKLLSRAEKTKTKFDDAGVQGLLDALDQSAVKYDIELLP